MLKKRSGQSRKTNVGEEGETTSARERSRYLVFSLDFESIRGCFEAGDVPQNLLQAQQANRQPKLP